MQKKFLTIRNKFPLRSVKKIKNRINFLVSNGDKGESRGIGLRADWEGEGRRK